MLVLDGIAAGLQSVAVPGPCGRAFLTISVAPMSAGVPSRPGWMAEEIGNSAMFLIRGRFTLGSIALGPGYASVLSFAFARYDRSGARRMTAALAGAR